MKLVEILARDLGEWQGTSAFITQDASGHIFAWDNAPSFDEGEWMAQSWTRVECKALLATDHATAIVTREMWEAERERLEDEQDAATVRERRGQETVNVDPDTLKEWRGPKDGLPPVGSEVECKFAYEDFERWHNGVCVAVGTTPEGSADICVIKSGERIAIYDTCRYLRPIRTDRDKWIDEAAEACGYLLAADGAALGMIYDKMIAKLPE